MDNKLSESEQERLAEIRRKVLAEQAIQQSRERRAQRSRQRSPSARGVAPRNPGLAAALSVILPGLGHIYNGQLSYGIAVLVLMPVVYVLAVFALLIAIRQGDLLWAIPMLVVFAAHIWAIYEAYYAAERLNNEEY